MYNVLRLLSPEKMKVVRNGNRGYSLIETLIAVLVLAVISVAVFAGLATAASANILSDKHTTAGSLARSQIEYIQLQPYDSVNNPPIYDVISNVPVGYTIVTPMVTRLDPKKNGTSNDDGMQQITVTVMHGTKTILTLTDYKVLK